MASHHMTVGELSSFLMYTFWVGISIAGERKKKVELRKTHFVCPVFTVILHFNNAMLFLLVVQV